MSLPLGPWRLTYTPGQWLVLAGPRLVAIMQPAPPKMSVLVNQLWTDMQAAGSLASLLEVLLTERPRDGWSVVNEQGETVALDLELTPELVRAGRAREVIRVVQEARKSAGLDVSDRILLRLAAGAELLEAIREHADLISDEVLAVDLQHGDVEDPTAEEPELGLTVKITKA